jgi:clan AA aspartic protease
MSRRLDVLEVGRRPINGAVALKENAMGEVVVDLKLENTIDRELVKRGLMKEEDVRALTGSAIVDSGARMLMLPQDIVEQLGLRELRKAIVIYADERKEERMVAGTVTVQVGERAAEVSCVVGPPASEILLGQVPLEIMDLLVDCGQQRLTPRPESPYLPLMRA